jgi:hypothetical protein
MSAVVEEAEDEPLAEDPVVDCEAVVDWEAVVDEPLFDAVVPVVDISAVVL